MTKDIQNVYNERLQLQQMFDVISEGVIRIDKEGNIVKANQAAQKILGLKKDDILSRNYIAPEWNIIRPDGSVMPPEEMAGPIAMKTKKDVQNMIMGIKNTDDSVTWLSVNASPLFDKDNEFIGVVGTFRDITQFKTHEVLLEKQQNEIKTMLKTAPIGIITIDFDGRFISANDYYQKMFGYSEEELCKRTVVDLCHEDDVDKAVRLLDGIMKKPEQSLYFKIKGINRQGESLFIKCIAAIIYDETNEPSFILAFIEDISDLIALEEEREKLVFHFDSILAELGLVRQLLDETNYFRTRNQNGINDAVNLTAKEKKILFYVMKGNKNKEIAEKLSMNESAVKKTVSNLFKKFKVKNRVSLVKMIHDHGGIESFLSN